MTPHSNALHTPARHTTLRALLIGALAVMAMGLVACGDADDDGSATDANNAASTNSGTTGTTNSTTSTNNSTTSTNNSTTGTNSGTGTNSSTAATPDQVVFAVFEAIGENDTEALDALIREDYIQHSALAADGRAGFYEALPLLSSLEVEVHRVFVDGDLVAMHSTYTFPDGLRMVAFDVFRIQDGQLAEHWDALQEEIPADATVSGRSMTDGPAQVSAPDQTEASRALVTEFVDVVLTQGDFDRITEYISTAQYDQHNPLVDDGLDGIGAFVSALGEQGLVFYYTDSPLVVAHGEFVLVGSEGVFGPADTTPFAIFYDLFRVEGGKIVEHWDIIPSPVTAPDALPHDNGYF